MKISIIVPSYNYKQYIDACLQSIQMQTYRDFEVLIADGGSKDGSLQIIEMYCENDHRFKLVSQEDKGQPDAINKALAFADGEIIGFLNSDDIYLSNDVFSVIANTFSAYKDVSIVSSGGYYIQADGKYIKPIHLRYHPLDNISWMKYRVACIQPSTFWKRNVSDSISFRTDFHFSFDSVFFYEAYTRFSWLEIPNITAGYRLHGENKSMSVKSKRIIELAAFEKIKFGQKSVRGLYLTFIGKLIGLFEKLGLIGTILSKIVYFVVNSLSFLTCYRLPGI